MRRTRNRRDEAGEDEPHPLLFWKAFELDKYPSPSLLLGREDKKRFRKHLFGLVAALVAEIYRRATSLNIKKSTLDRYLSME
jgi:hypothetical protein